MVNLLQYRSLTTKYLSEKNRILYEFSTSAQRLDDLESVYSSYCDALFSDNVVEESFASIDTCSSGESRSREWLARFAFEENFAYKVRQCDYRVRKAILKADYDYDQYKIRQPLSDAERKEVYDRILKLKKGCQDDFRLRMEEKRRSYQKLNTYLKTITQGKGFVKDLCASSLSLLKTQLQEFISASDGYYASHLEKFSSRFLSQAPEDLQPWNIPWLLSGRPFDALFQDWSSTSLVKRTLMGLGVDLKKVDTITIDIAQRRGKSISPFCGRVLVPQEIYVSFYPVGGIGDILNLFHLLGEALQSAHVSPENPVEYLQLGDRALWHTWGFLFQYLLLNREWLRDFARLEDSEDFRDFLHFRKLYLLRSRAVSFINSFDFFQGHTDSWEQLITKTASQKQEVLRHPYDREFAFSSLPCHFGTVDYLRGWIFEAELREILVRKFGERWYSRPGAGDFLKELWSYGQQFSAVELAAKIRHLELDINPLQRELEPR